MEPVWTLRLKGRSFAAGRWAGWFLAATFFSTFVSQGAVAQAFSNSVDAASFPTPTSSYSVVKPPPATTAQPPVARELTFVSLASYGHYKIFASGSGAKLYTSGVEYDRNSWGRLLGARFDYVAEFLPFVLLDAPAQTDIWGNPMTKVRKLVPGVGFSPIGFRLLWRDGKAIKPYLMAKGGVIIFTQKELSQQATYENFSLQSNTGLQVKMTPRIDLRLGLFGDFHFSDDFIVPVNPGLDVMNASLGITYHLGHPPPVH